MYNIRRIRLDHVGFDDAWYQNMEIPLFNTSDSDGPPDHTLINLVNGGGKTTLISLVFSCFVPSKSDFVQHLQKSTHKFEHYFDREPGLILIELESARGNLLIPERLIIGQYVSVVAEESNPDKRYYFGFPPGDLKFEDVPCHAGSESFNSISDARAWLARAKEEHSDFVFFDLQEDWKQWLESQGVDVWLAKKQVEFCSSEGGIDRFLDFKSEMGFLKRFFYMALNPKNAETVRDTLEEGLKKLSYRPGYEARIDLLRNFEQTLRPFRDAASDFLEACERLKEARRRCFGLNAALENAIATYQADVRTLEEELQSSRKQEASFRKRVEQTEADIEALTLFDLRAKTSELENEFNRWDQEFKRLTEVIAEYETALVLREKSPKKTLSKTLIKASELRKPVLIR